jgi:serine/threonine protein kinase
MSDVSSDLEALFAKFVEAHVVRGEVLRADEVCGGRSDLVEPLEALIHRYRSLTDDLGGDALVSEVLNAPTSDAPAFDGFQTIERIGAGGMGEVYKLRDLRLDRIVAAKVLRRDPRVPVRLTQFLGEARSMALFSDRRIVRIFEFRPEPERPVIIMEYVDGFELGHIGPSLEFAQRARVLLEVCEAVHYAHTLGVQHRDLKPSNIMVDAQLAPRILDFGLSTGDPNRGHLKGTIQYVAPEQLDPSRPLDERTDIYALGVILYELICGRLPYAGLSDEQILAAIRSGHPQLPIERDPRVPEPLQAIALKAMEADPAMRYASALDMTADLRRYVEGRPVLARPSTYSTTLTTRIGTHVQQIGEWLRLRLIYPHEAERLRTAYRSLEGREEDWILESRALTHMQVALYLGAFLLLCGSLFYFAAERWYEAVEGVLRPLGVLGLPFVGLNAAARLLYRRDHKAVAVAFCLAAVSLLPLLLIILFHETGILVVPKDTPGQLFQDGSISNRQLQITTLVAAAWCGWLAIVTRTAALSTVFTVLAMLVGISVLADFGLRDWFEDGRWDLLAIYTFPVVAALAALGTAAERRDRPWLAHPLYGACALLLILVLELLALDGRAFQYLGFSLHPFQSISVSDPLLLDTIAAMTINGVVFYVLADALHRRGSGQTGIAARILFAVSPFALLQPLGHLVRTNDYSLRYDWIYLACAIAIVLLSETRQRRAFFYAGILNTGAALFFIAHHRDWLDKPTWAVAVIAAGLAALSGGFLLSRRGRALN